MSFEYPSRVKIFGIPQVKKIIKIKVIGYDDFDESSEQIYFSLCMLNGFPAYYIDKVNDECKSCHYSCLVSINLEFYIYTL